jgi:hypothetical protein
MLREVSIHNIDCRCLQGGCGCRVRADRVELVRNIKDMTLSGSAKMTVLAC